MKTLHTLKLLPVLVLIVLVTTSAVVASTANPIKITIATYPQDGRPEWFQAAAAEFMARNPDVQVEVQSGWWAQFGVWAAGGVFPDIVHFDAQYLSQMVVLGMIRPIDDYFAKDFNSAPYIPILFESLKYKGKLYGIPRDIDVAALRYNRDIFQSRGMGDITKAWTWEELVSNGKKLTMDTNGDGVIDIWGFMDFWGNSLITPIWVWQAGGVIWNKDHTDTFVDTPEVVAGYKMQYDLRYTHNIAPKTEDPAFKSGNPLNHFPQGQIAIAMHMKGVMSPHSLQFDYGVAPLTIGPSGKPVSGMVLGFLGISNTTPNADAAWRFIKYLSSRDGFEAGREENKEKGFYSLLSPITAQTLEIIKKDAERGGEWWLAMTQVARITDGKHPTGQFSIAKPNWGDIIAGQSVHDDCAEIAANVRLQIQELIAQGYTW